MAAKSDTLMLAGQTYVLVGAEGKAPKPADTKEPVKPTPSLVKGLLRQTLRKAGKGKVPITRVRLPYSFVGTSTVTTGVVNTTLAIYADLNVTEWNAFAALYDEYRVLGGECKFTASYQCPVGAAVSPDSQLFVLGYDPADGAALTGVRAGTELTQHVLLASSPFVPGATTAVMSNAIQTTTGVPHSLRWRTGPVTALQISSMAGAVISAPGNWKAVNTAGNNAADGYLKMYGICDAVASQNVVAGINFLDIEFRSRR